MRASAAFYLAVALALAGCASALGASAAVGRGVGGSSRGVTRSETLAAVQTGGGAGAAANMNTELTVYNDGELQESLNSDTTVLLGADIYLSTFTIVVDGQTGLVIDGGVKLQAAAAEAEANVQGHEGAWDAIEAVAEKAPRFKVAGLSQRRCFAVSGAATEVSFQNLSISEGAALDGAPGGGLAVSGGAVVTLTDCLVANHTAAGSYGGGMYVAGSATVTLLRCTVTGNAATGGGGIFVRDTSSLTLTSCELWHNIADRGYGGGLCVLARKTSWINIPPSPPKKTHCILCTARNASPQVRHERRQGRADTVLGDGQHRAVRRGFLLH